MQKIWLLITPEGGYIGHKSLTVLCNEIGMKHGTARNALRTQAIYTTKRGYKITRINITPNNCKGGKYDILRGKI